MRNFNKTLLVIVFAVILFCFISVTSGDAQILNTNDGVDPTLSRLQKAISLSYQNFQGGEFNYDLVRNFGDGVRLFLNVDDPINLPTIGVSPNFQIRCANPRLTELFGPTTIWLA
ncbi:hypothetical protein Fcan01_20784 [Folsomia candida]|uniref:Uncharacterized protein n=1 Tax=Folsomia candida TaxID=158441 RepID=A0A226DG77_FOLCA|nr:hypothetical protein Fcan01_20784 [Folsomia candida]